MRNHSIVYRAVINGAAVCLLLTVRRAYLEDAPIKSKRAAILISRGLGKFLQVSTIPIRIVGLVKCPKITGQLYTRTVIFGRAMGTRTFAQLTVNQGIGENFAAKAHAMLGRTSGCAFGVKLPKPIRGPAAIAAGSTARSLAAIHGQAGAGANVGSCFGKGLKVKAIRKAPIPIAQEPTYSHV
jgi:hypothetical protein